MANMEQYNLEEYIDSLQKMHEIELDHALKLLKESIDNGNISKA